MAVLPYVLVGLVAGLLSGIFGIGGGSILIPALVIIFGMSQHMAQGTTLAIMLPPVFVFAVLKYYQQGHVNMPVALWMALGLTVGAFLGAQIVQYVPDLQLKRAFGIFLMLIGLKMFF